MPRSKPRADAATIAADRHRLTSRDPIAVLIASFVESGDDSLEIIAPLPGTVLDNGATFLDTPDTTPFKMHQRFYTVALRGHWLHDTIWVRKAGRSVFLHATEESYLAGRAKRS